MLIKLLKYEFMATAQTFGLLYLVLAASSLGLGLWLGKGATSGGFGSSVDLGLMLGVLYVAAIIALVIVTLYNIVQRFNRNLLGREGYLMHTLPVTGSYLIFSKLIAAVVWSVCSILAGCLSIVVITLGLIAGEGVRPAELAMEVFGRDWTELWQWFQLSFGMSVGQFLTAFVLITLASGVCLILRIYAACMVGHQAKKHPVLAGIGVFFAFSWVQSLLINFIMNAGTLAREALAQTPQAEDITVAAVVEQAAVISSGAYWGSVLSYVAMYLAFAALYFVAAMYLMNNRLNLE